MNETRRPLFMPVAFLGGLLFGTGLAVGRMTRMEVVLDFLQVDDLGLLFVMGGAAVVSGLAFGIASRSGRAAPLTGTIYGLRERSFDRDVVVGGTVFGVGWGLSGMCPGAAYASLGVGNVPILWGIVGMFAGAYLQGRWRTAVEADSVPPVASR